MSTPNQNNLGTIVESARVRKIIYSAYVVAIVIIGAIQVGFAAISAGQPEWLTVALAVAAYLGVPVGGLAVANTSTSEPVRPVVMTINAAHGMDEAEIGRIASNRLRSDFKGE